jgi:hypothetical protein
MRCRKNYRDLTPGERSQFAQALHHVKATGIVDQFASDHENFFHDAHHSSHFLPWHREFLRRFELALRTFDPDIAIPYWNSTVDTNASDPLWDAGFLGQFDAAWSLNRALGSVGMSTPQDVQTALTLGTYDAIWPTLEGPIHNNPHNWVEGVMSTAASPGDPIFYLHHCWIDMLWAQWQLLNPGAPFVSSGSGRDLNDAMAPWSTTPADVMDHRAINLYHYPSGFQKDLPEVSLDTPSINFLNVPQGETRLGAAVFSVAACEPIPLTIVAGPSVISGPAGTTFGVATVPMPPGPSADSKRRLWFTYKGTTAGDTATGVVTVRCEDTGEQWDIGLTADTVARPTAAVVLVLDQSNSMTFDSGIGPGVKRQDVLKFSAPPAVDVVDDGHAIAVCTFDHDAHPGIGMTPVAATGKLTINSAIAGYAPNPNGWTSIGEGVAFAQGLLDAVTGYDVEAMVVLTDGQENHGPHTRRSIDQVAGLINDHVFAIGLGRPEVLDPGALQKLCDGHDGYMVMTGDLTPDAYFRMAKYYQQILAGVTNNEIVVDPEGWLSVGQEHRIPFWLSETDLLAKGILLCAAPQYIRYRLETPDGDLIDPGMAAAHPMAAFDMGSHVSLYRVALPIPIGANQGHAGRWHAILSIDPRLHEPISHVRAPLAGAWVAPHGLRYSMNVHAYSCLRMKARVIQTSYEPGATLIVRAILTEYAVPVAGRASCSAELLRPDNSAANVTMTEIEPGVFEGAVVAVTLGVYRFRIVASGLTLRGRRFTREQTLTGAVWRGGDVPPPPPGGRGGESDGEGGCLCGIIECLLRQRSVQEVLRRIGLSAEELQTCLEVCCREHGRGSQHETRSTLATVLRSVIRDDAALKVVLHEVERVLPAASDAR